MSFLICEKHNKYEKTGTRTLTNALICMNKYCPDSFKVFCSACESEHEDHVIKILTIEDVSFLIDRLLKVPSKDITQAIGETLNIMKKLKLIKEFRRKIDMLEREIRKESMKMVDQTEILINEYSLGKESAQRLAQLFTNIESLDTYQQFVQNSAALLSSLDYNSKKDRFEFGSGIVKEKEELRRQFVDYAKRGMEEMRDYSMKVIEVTLHKDDSDDQSELPQQRRQYQHLKEEFYSQDNEEEQEESFSQLKKSTSTANKSQFKREHAEIECQTEHQYFTRQEVQNQIDKAINELKQKCTLEQAEYQFKMSETGKQKQQLSLQLASIQGKYNQKKKVCLEIEAKLRQNRTLRLQKQRHREFLMTKIIEFSQSKAQGIQEKE